MDYILIFIIEIINKLIKASNNDIPRGFDKCSIESIRARGFIRRNIFKDIINLFASKRTVQVNQMIISLKKGRRMEKT